MIESEMRPMPDRINLRARYYALEPGDEKSLWKTAREMSDFPTCEVNAVTLTARIKKISSTGKWRSVRQCITTPIRAGYAVKTDVNSLERQLDFMDYMPIPGRG